MSLSKTIRHLPFQFDFEQISKVEKQTEGMGLGLTISQTIYIMFVK
ncbi:hypothetical protein [Rivularia sp. PCC 7116]|nr:hypothetical protein [Rivularia sp. PCC 7116]